MWIWLGGLVVGLAAGSALVAARRGGGAPGEAEVCAWIDEVLARHIAVSLGRPRATVEEVLAGAHPELRPEIERLVREVLLHFARVSVGRQVEVRLLARLEGARLITACFSVDWKSLPGPVREELLRSGRPVVSMPWLPAWKGSHAI